jgi:hypothetical protein
MTRKWQTLLPLPVHHPVEHVYRHSDQLSVQLAWAPSLRFFEWYMKRQTSHLLRGWKDRIGKGRERRSYMVVRFKYPESSKSQQMIDVPLSLKSLVSLLFMQVF